MVEIILQAMALDPTLTEATEITVGEAFSFANEDSDLFYFPIHDQGEMKLLYRVYEYEGQMQGIMSAYLVDEINEIAEQSDEPISIYEADGEIVAEADGEEETLAEIPDEYQTEEAEVLDAEALEVIELDQPLEIEYQYEEVLDQISEDKAVMTSRGFVIGPNGEIIYEPDDYHMIPVGGTIDLLREPGAEARLAWEKQEGSWCSGYVTTGILRYFGVKVRAEDMGRFYGYSRDKGFEWAELENYPARYGYRPTRINQRISNDLYSQQLKKKSPMMMVITDQKGKGGVHALLAHGYNHGAGTSAMYIIRNPWYETTSESFYENAKKDVIYVPYTHKTYSYKWTSTLYNYKK